MAPVSSEAAKRKTLSRERALAMGRLIYPSVPFAGVCKACLGSLLQRAASIASCRGSRPFATSPRFGTRVEPPPPIFRRFLIVIDTVGFGHSRVSLLGNPRLSGSAKHRVQRRTYLLSNFFFAVASSLSLSSPTFGYAKSRSAKASITAAATITRVNHLLSAATTYHGASFVAVCWIICSYACM